MRETEQGSALIWGTHIRQWCLLSELNSGPNVWAREFAQRAIDDDNKHRGYVRRFLQRQNTGKQEYFEMILARTQQNRKAPHFLYAKENTVFLYMKEAPRGAV